MGSSLSFGHARRVSGEMTEIATPQIEPTVIAYAIRADGTQVLIEARGPKSTMLQRWRANRNRKKWNAERAHLLQD